ncbi:MAG: hypothetical protein JOZ39_01515, partial [Chloroflexi bacterium]|nr:hypothetical protein [Chloroflexota bacterium]
MEPAQALYELQELDLEIGRDQAALEADRAKMQEPAAVRQLRAAVLAGERKLEGLRAQVRATEQEAASVAAKRKAVHDKLYSGATSVPRELAALESEEAALAQTVAQIEDRELDLMASVEQIETEIKANQQAVQEGLAHWRQEGQEAHDHIATLEQELAKL